MIAGSQQPSVENRLRIFSRAVAALAVVAGLAVSLGWVLDVGALRSVLPELVTMKVNTAIGFVLCGAALWLMGSASPRANHGSRVWLMRSCAAVVALTGVLTIGEYVFGWDAGIDQVLWREGPQAMATSHPGRMSPATALNFAILGLAFLMMDVETRGGRRPAQWLALLVFLDSFVALLGYAYGIRSLYRGGAYTAMALHTAVLFVLIPGGFLCARPSRGWMRLIIDSGPAGALVRRLLPAAILVPPIVGGFRLAGERAGLYGFEFGLALFAMSNVVVFATLVWWVAGFVRSTETERRKAELMLRESEKHFRTLADAAPVMVWMTGTDKLCYYVNLGWLQFTGRTMEQESGNGWAQGIHPDDLKRSIEIYTSSFDKRSPFEMEYRYRRRDGVYRWILDRGVPHHNPGGEFLGYIGSCTDITDRKRAEAALQKSEELYREVVETQTELVCRHRADTTLTFVNKAYCRFFGRKREALLGRKFLELAPPLAQETIMRDIALLSEQRKVITAEQEHVLPGGNIAWLVWTAYAILAADGTVAEFQAIGRDITDRKRAREAERNLARASRLAIVGELTAIVAHEVSQPLGAILCNAETAEHLLNSTTPPLHIIRDILSDIQKSGLRAGEVMDRIRALVKNRELNLQPLNLNEVVQDVVRLVTGDARRRKVEIHEQLEPQLPLIRGDEVQLQQVLLNLLLNGMDAMAQTPETTRRLTLKTSRNGDSTIHISVSDRGHGIRDDVLPHIFRSFITTKKEGMGLGLSIARSIVETHGGRIFGENNPGGGAVFRIELPVLSSLTEQVSPNKRLHPAIIGPTQGI